ncbi:MAG TPA: VWA domain-containing protein [Chitinophagaceae bacterium]|nr:VWA domain-containing protein [Chitinophagaceae bacterium]
MIYDWLQNIEFKYVWLLPVLGMLPVAAWLYFRTAKKRKASLMVSNAAAFKLRTFKNNLRHLPLWLRLLALGCLILALARPQTKNIQNRTRGEGIDIVLCMDVSGSMLSRDFYPDRLTVAKEVAAEFVQSRPVDQIGLVIFSGESFTQFPVSTDHESLLQQIQNLRSGMLESGTVIGEGLATSVDRLQQSKARSRIVVLLTDGKEEPPETRLIDPYSALEIAKAKGVKVYTIGMLAEASATIGEGGAKGLEKTFVDENLLGRIATQTGGQYFRAADKEGLQKIYAQIDKLEKSAVEVVTRERVDEKFAPFIFAALFLLALEWLLRYTLLRTFP